MRVWIVTDFVTTPAEIVGIFSTKKKAERAISKICDRPGSSYEEDDFTIRSRTIDVINEDYL